MSISLTCLCAVEGNPCRQRDNMHRKCQPMRWNQELSSHEATVLITWCYRSVLSLKTDFSKWMIPSKVSSVWNVFRLASVSRCCGYQHKTFNMEGWVCFSFLRFYFKKKPTEITETFSMCEKRCMQFLGGCNEAPPQAALTHLQRLQRLMLSWSGTAAL